jgi:hypothetical protein
MKMNDHAMTKEKLILVEEVDNDDDRRTMDRKSVRAYECRQTMSVDVKTKTKSELIIVSILTNLSDETLTPKIYIT